MDYFLASGFNTVYGYIIVVVIVLTFILVCWLIRRHFKIGTYTKDEEKNMKSNLDLLLKEEDKEEGKDYRDDV